MRALRLSSGPAEVIASGTVIPLNLYPVEIEFGEGTDKLRVVFRFIDEQGKDDTRVEAAQLDQRTVEVKLHNFTNPLGAGSWTALKIGFLSGLLLYRHYRVYDIGEGRKTLHYTIYQLRAAE